MRRSLRRKVHRLNMPLRTVFVLLAIAALSAPGLSPAQESVAQLAATPPMGWNSWDSYGPSVREDEVKANVDFIADKLLKFGWQYVVVDIEWYQPDAHAHGYI